MSEKNFASYGDMETLVTEIASKCGPYTEITYEDWLQLTPYQQEHGRWDVTGVPGADGAVSIDLMTKLWENSNPTQSIEADTEFNINTAGYDLVMFTFAYSTSYLQNEKSVIIPQGSSTILTYTNVNGSAQMIRGFDYVSDTKYKANAGYRNKTIDATVAIPLVAYGIKLHHTVEIKAIAPSVSTLAKNSVFDPTGTDLESTNAEDAIKELEANFQDGVDAVYDAVVAKGSTPASHSLSDIIAAIAAIPTGITPSGTLSITSNGTGIDVTEYANADVAVPNSNSGTYTFPANDTGGTKDLGVANTYRYVNAGNVYNKGKADGASGKYTPQFTYVGNAAGSYNAWRYDNLFSFSAVNGGIYALAMGGTSSNSTGLSGSGFTQLGWWRNANAGLALFRATSTTVKVGRNGDWPYNNNGFVLIRIG